MLINSFYLRNILVKICQIRSQQHVIAIKCYKHRATFNALQEDTYLRRNLEYLRRHPDFAASTFRLAGFRQDIIEDVDSVLRNLGLQSKVNNGGNAENQTNIRSLNKVELQTLLYALADKKTSSFLEISDDFVKVLDMECARRVILWDAQTCLLMIDLWMAWRGHIVVHGTFFNVLLQEWANSSRTPFSDNSKRRQLGTPLFRLLVQLMLYVGMRKSSPSALMSKSERIFDENVNQMTNKELIIVCQGFFKTATPIESNNLLAEIAKRVKSCLRATNADQSLDEFDIISMLKILRHAKFADDDLLVELSRCLKSGNLRPSNLIALAHLAATFADSKFYDRDLFSLLEKMFMRELIEKKQSSSGPVTERTPLLKDIARILWALSSLAHRTCDSRFAGKVINNLREYVVSNQHLKNGDRFVDCLQSLILLGIFPRDLLMTIRSTRFNTEINRLKKRKPLHQLFFINESLKIEAPDLNVDRGDFDELRPPLIESEEIFPRTELFNEFIRRPAVDAVRSAIHAVCKGNTDFYRCVHLLKHIHIVGKAKILKNIFRDSGFQMAVSSERQFCDISGNSDHRIAIEVLDPAVCLRDSFEPDGRMSTKIRQLRRLGFKVIQISSDNLRHFMNLSEDSRIEWLRDYLLKSVF